MVTGFCCFWRSSSCAHTMRARCCCCCRLPLMLLPCCALLFLVHGASEKKRGRARRSWYKGLTLLPTYTYA